MRHPRICTGDCTGGLCIAQTGSVKFCRDLDSGVNGQCFDTPQRSILPVVTVTPHNPCSMPLLRVREGKEGATVGRESQAESDTKYYE